MFKFDGGEGEVVVSSAKCWNRRSRRKTYLSLQPLAMKLQGLYLGVKTVCLTVLQSVMIPPLPHNTFNYDLIPLFPSFRTDMERSQIHSNEEYDEFYGCACQRFLFIGLMSPFLLVISVTGFILWLFLLPCEYPLSYVSNQPPSKILFLINHQGLNQGFSIVHFYHNVLYVAIFSKKT